MFKIFKTKEFDDNYNKLDNSEKKRADKIRDQLSKNGNTTGKPLSGLKFFREKKFDGKRIYYLVYKEFNCILVIAISDKKAQQATINQILFNLNIYKNDIANLIKDQNHA